MIHKKITFFVLGSVFLCFSLTVTAAVPDDLMPKKALIYYHQKEPGITEFLVSLLLMASRIHGFSYKYPAPEHAWPDIQMDLGKGSTQEILDSKELCGSMIYASRYLAETIDPGHHNGVRLGMGILFMAPALFQANDEFNYGQADLPTILTIFSIKTSNKLMDLDIGSHSLAAVTYFPIVVILWSYHGALSGTSKPYLWLATPKIFMSSSLNHAYKGIVSLFQPQTGSVIAHGTSGLLALGFGFVLNKLATGNWLPGLDGFTTSFVGKVGKLSGYGLGDLETKLIDRVESHPVIGGYLKALALGQTLVLLDVLMANNYWPYLTASLRRGLIVKSALANIELQILVLSQVIRQMSDNTFNTELMSLDYQGWNTHSSEPETAEKGCFYTPLPGFSTELYRLHCTVVLENKQP